LYVTMHVQVDPSLPLDKANQIAESVESAIDGAIPEVRHITVHIEPSLPERTSAEIVEDQHLSDAILTSIQFYPEVREIKSILTYTTGDKLHINVHCDMPYLWD